MLSFLVARVTKKEEVMGENRMLDLRRKPVRATLPPSHADARKPAKNATAKKATAKRAAAKRAGTKRAGTKTAGTKRAGTKRAGAKKATRKRG